MDRCSLEIPGEDGERCLLSGKIRGVRGSSYTHSSVMLPLLWQGTLTVSAVLAEYFLLVSNDGCHG